MLLRPKTGFTYLCPTNTSLVEKYPKEIAKILEYLPQHPERHTVAFSKTYPSNIESIGGLLKPDFATVDCSDQVPIEFTQSKGLIKRMKLKTRMMQRDLTEPIQGEPVQLHPLWLKFNPLFAAECAASNESLAQELEDLLAKWFVDEDETHASTPLYGLWRVLRSKTTHDANQRRERLTLLTMLVQHKATVDGYDSRWDFTDMISSFVQRVKNEAEISTIWSSWIDDLHQAEKSREESILEEKKFRSGLYEQRKMGIVSSQRYEDLHSDTDEYDSADDDGGTSSSDESETENAT